MYTRQNIAPRDMKIPENYSGHAFSSSGGYSDMPPPLRQPTPRPLPIKQPPYSDIPPNERGEMPDKKNDFVESLPETDAEQIPETDRGEDLSQDIPKSLDKDPKFIPTNAKIRDDDRRSSIFSALLPQSRSLAGNFPFGHGIGSEELLILAVMLLIYLSGAEEGKNDYEFMILLGLLLFAG